ncbi:hypothetical protein [Streptacidiphilus sp. EB103A]|uniref:hypothetical protein n=1 Tax=Streptacidiphilus sp. EB103A TaxID=3156275 RepID=UPI003511EBC7
MWITDSTPVPFGMSPPKRCFSPTLYPPAPCISAQRFGPDVKAAWARPRRYATVRDNVQVKEVDSDSGDRFILCFNPEQAKRGKAVRDQMPTQLESAIEHSDKPAGEQRQLAQRPGFLLLGGSAGLLYPGRPHPNIVTRCYTSPSSGD